MRQIEEFQRQALKPRNWFRDIPSNGVYDQPQERYHEYMARKNREEDLKDGRDI